MMYLCDVEFYIYMFMFILLILVIDCGMVLYKMICLLIYVFGGEGYFNFEGNEFGYFEWLDFFCEGNQNFFWYVCCQLNLIEDCFFWYQFFNNFDCFMNLCENKYGWLYVFQVYILFKYEGDKVIIFEWVGVVFVFNFYLIQSFENYCIGVDVVGIYRVVFDFDIKEYGGFSRVDLNIWFFIEFLEWNYWRNCIYIYFFCRIVLVFVLELIIIFNGY